MKKILYKLQDLKSSFWLLPLLILTVGVAVAIMFLYIDINYGFTKHLLGAALGGIVAILVHIIINYI